MESPNRACENCAGSLRAWEYVLCDTCASLTPEAMAERTAAPELIASRNKAWHAWLAYRDSKRTGEVHPEPSRCVCGELFGPYHHCAKEAERSARKVQNG